jgi:trehalose 6-phosphate phosphatase
MTDTGTGPPWPSRPALFLDLDGTLIEFAATPDGVAPSARFRRLLADLAALGHGAVAFVSGRTIADLDSLLAPYHFALAGLHGVERRRADGSRLPSPVTARDLDPVRKQLADFAAARPGVVLEDKSLALAVHYRQAPALADEVAALGIELAASLPHDWEILEGNHVLEIKPAGSNKGAAIRAFMDERPFVGRTPVFVGDDVTDEDGFRVVNELGGVSVKVNHGPTHARWRLPDVDAVTAWLEANTTA